MMARVMTSSEGTDRIRPGGRAEPKLIITDDDPFARSELCEYLGKSKMACAEVASGGALLEYLEHSPGHAIVLLDLYIPGDDVCETIARLSALPNPVALILFSGYPSAILENVAHLALSYGSKVVGVLNKPFSLQTLDHLIRRARHILKDDAPPVESVELPAELSFRRQEILDAMSDSQIIAFYQPQVSVRDEKCHVLEALVRWAHPSFGLLEPKRFLGDVKRQGLFKELTYHMLHEICVDMAHWQSAGFKPDIAINVYPELLVDPDFSLEFLRVIGEHKIDPRCIIVELTEDAFLIDQALALEALIRMHMVGIRISIDDFGTEHSSLSRLLWLPISEIKIDRSFIDAFDTRKNAMIIVKEVIELAHKLGLSVVAEGVETDSVFHLLKKLNCDSVQGHLFSTAMPAKRIIPWVRGRRPNAGLQVG